MSILIKRFRKPKVYRTVYTYDPKEIYQIDIMSLRGLRKRLPEDIADKLDEYALIAVDVYSRVCWGVGLPNRQYKTIRNGLRTIFEEMGKPYIVSADGEIINAMGNQFNDILKYQTSPEQKNKNAIVERWIETIKGRLLKYITEGYVDLSEADVNVTDDLIKTICYDLNNSKHKGIDAIPMNIWVGKDTNHKPIIKYNYPKLHVGDLVLRAPQPPRHGAVIYARMFDVDPNIFVVVNVVGSKYRINNIVNIIDNKTNRDNKLYEPYELRNITDKWREVVDSQLFTYYIKKTYGVNMYDKIVQYLEDHYA